jgi:hypothetical protein
MPLREGDNVFTGHNDLWRSSSSARRTCASLPASCEVAETFLKTSVPAGQNLYACHLSLYDPTAALASGQVLSLMHSAALNCWREISSPTATTISYAFRDGLANSSGLIDVTPDPSVLVLIDVFPAWQSGIAPFGQLKWGTNLTGTGAALGNVAVMPGHPSVKPFTSGSATGNYYLIELVGYCRITDTFANLGSGRDFSSWESCFIVQVDHAAGVAAVSNLTTCLGFMNTSSIRAGAGVPGIAVPGTCSAIICSKGTWNPAHWMFVTALPGTNSNWVDTNVAANSATQYHSKICSPPTGTVKLASNGADVATSSTEVPHSPPLPCMTTLRALPHRSPSGLTTAVLEEWA